MTHSPTPTELLALKAAHAAEASKDASYDLVSTIVFALGAAQLLQAPETPAELVRLRARVAELEADRNRDVAEWLGKKASEYRSTRGREHALQAEVLERMADKVRRGAIRPREDQYVSPLHQDHLLGHDLPEYPHA